MKADGVRGLPGAGEWNAFWRGRGADTEDRPSWSKRRILALVDPLVKDAAPAARVLDAGCGSGFFSRHFASRGCRVTALDYSSEALEATRALTSGRCSEYLRDDLLDASFGGRHAGKFDLVFTDGLLEHFPRADQLRILGNLRASLAPRGVVATFVPNRWSPWQLIRPYMMPGIHEEPLESGELTRLHAEAGLKVVTQGGINVAPWRFSPDALLGSRVGMLLYVLAV